jgi:hypothetical protein
MQAEEEEKFNVGRALGLNTSPAFDNWDRGTYADDGRGMDDLRLRDISCSPSCSGAS